MQLGQKVSRSQAPKHRFSSVAIRRKILTPPSQDPARIRTGVRQSPVLPVPARSGGKLISQAIRFSGRLTVTACGAMPMISGV